MRNFLDWLLGRKYYEFSIHGPCGTMALASKSPIPPDYMQPLVLQNFKTGGWDTYPVKVREISRQEYEAS